MDITQLEKNFLYVMYPSAEGPYFKYWLEDKPKSNIGYAQIVNHLCNY